MSSVLVCVCLSRYAYLYLYKPVLCTPCVHHVFFLSPEKFEKNVDKWDKFWEIVIRFEKNHGKKLLGFSEKKWFVIISPIGHELWRHWWRRCSRTLPMVMTSLRWYPKNVNFFFLKNSQKNIWQICVICQNRSNNKKVMTVLILSYNVNQWRNKWRHLTGLSIFAGHLFIFLKCVTY